jgi:hypothetical protein
MSGASLTPSRAEFDAHRPPSSSLELHGRQWVPGSVRLVIV